MSKTNKRVKLRRGRTRVRRVAPPQEERQMIDAEICAETFEQTRAKLEELERTIAMAHGIVGNRRLQIIARIKSGALREDETLADWHAAYCSYQDWLREER